MKMKKITLDESILDFDAWLDQEILNSLTEEVFGVKIISENFYLNLPELLKSKISYTNVGDGKKEKVNSKSSYSNLEYTSIEYKKLDYSLDVNNVKEFAA